MATLIESLISGIIVTFFILYSEITSRKIDPEDIDIVRELKEQWKGSKEDFIDFKKFQYGREFSLISEITPFLIFSLTIGLIGFKDILIPLVGLTIYSSLIVSVMVVLFKIIIVLRSANRKAANNLKILYNLKQRKY